MENDPARCVFESLTEAGPGPNSGLEATRTCWMRKMTNPLNTACSSQDFCLTKIPGNFPGIPREIPGNPRENPGILIGSLEHEPVRFFWAFFGDYNTKKDSLLAVP